MSSEDTLPGAEDATELEEEETLPIIPTIDTRQRDLEEREVAYAAGRREAGDVVVSGPIIGGWGPGRYFQNRMRAHQYCVAVYGADRVKELEGRTRGRWSFLISGLKRPEEGLRSNAS